MNAKIVGWCLLPALVALGAVYCGNIIYGLVWLAFIPAKLPLGWFGYLMMPLLVLVFLNFLGWFLLKGKPQWMRPAYACNLIVFLALIPDVYATGLRLAKVGGGGQEVIVTFHDSRNQGELMLWTRDWMVLKDTTDIVRVSLASGSPTIEMLPYSVAEPSLLSLPILITIFGVLVTIVGLFWRESLHTMNRKSAEHQATLGRTHQGLQRAKADFESFAGELGQLRNGLRRIRDIHIGFLQKEPSITNKAYAINGFRDTARSDHRKALQESGLETGLRSFPQTSIHLERHEASVSAVRLETTALLGDLTSAYSSSDPSRQDLGDEFDSIFEHLTNLEVYCRDQLKGIITELETFRQR